MADYLNVYYVAIGGSDTLNNGLTPGAAFASIIKAQSVAVTGDLIMVGPGTFAPNLVNSYFSGVDVIGSGIDSTYFIESGELGVTGPVWPVGNNHMLSDVTIQCDLTADAVRMPIGFDSTLMETNGLALPTGFVGKRIKIIGNSDGIYMDAAATTTTVGAIWRWYDCQIICKYDCVRLFDANLTNEFHNCNILTDALAGDPALSPTNSFNKGLITRAIHAQKGNVKVVGGRLHALNTCANSTQTTPIYAHNQVKAKLIGVRLDGGATGTGAAAYLDAQLARVGTPEGSETATMQLIGCTRIGTLGGSNVANIVDNATPTVTSPAGVIPAAADVKSGVPTGSTVGTLAASSGGGSGVIGSVVG